MQASEGAALKINKFSDLMPLALILVVIMLLLVPLPTALLDLFLAVNLSGALTVLFLTMYITHSLQFAAFPSFLLMATLFRLSLSVAATRLILSQADAGKIIESFGGFVISGSYVVGIIVFLILVIIQFLVITNGSSRVAEVAARFTLDAMPGKQMSIDADLNAGVITEDEARARRKVVEQEADFYGAMDGASKFVKGDAIIGILIVLVNIIGGFIIGAIGGLDIMESLQKYSTLAIGNGLITQIPALLISTAAGILVTRAASESSIGKDISSQISAQPKVIAFAGGIMLFGLLVPGLPKLPFLIVGSLGLASAFLITRETKRVEADAIEEERSKQVVEGRTTENINALLQVDPMELEMGYGLIPLVDPDQGGELLGRVTIIRRQIALELGIVVPPIRIRDNMQLSPNAYCIKIKGIQIAAGELLLGRYLAMHAGEIADPIEGPETTEPAFGLPATWVTESQKEEAEIKGYTVVDPSSVVATHLTEVLRSHSYEVLGRQEVQSLIDNMKQTHPVIVEELIPNVITIGEIQKILQNLLKERVSIRDLVTVLECIGDHAGTTKDIDVLTEYVRQAIARSICKSLIQDNKLSVITVDPAVEQTISESVQHTNQGSYLAIDPATAQQVHSNIAKQIENAASLGISPVIVTSPSVRMYFKRLSEKTFPNLAVLSYNEIVPEIQVESIGMVGLNAH